MQSTEAQRGMGGTTGRRRRPHPIQNLQPMIHGSRETEYISILMLVHSGHRQVLTPRRVCDALVYSARGTTRRDLLPGA